MDITVPPTQSGKDHAVIETLYELSKNKKKGVRFKTYDRPWITCDSWTMIEHMYKKKNEFPTQARGLFTCPDDQGRHRVLVRGYDKFFNINETPATHWTALADDTVGPYEVTAKENGCIIFVAAASKDTVVVTSKHAIPEIKDSDTSHAGVGYRWLLKHLASVNKGEKDLAFWLYDMQVTLVAELCDDAFEEHILPYRELERGLYLHGINHNRTSLHSLPMAKVKDIAHNFGLRSVDFEELTHLEAVKAASVDIQQTGRYKGREVEGLVVRCKKNDGNPLFFKIKNDQYLAYREYREITKQLLRVTPPADDTSPPTIEFVLDKRPRCRFEKSVYYLLWLKERVKDTPEWFWEYQHNKNIVLVREAFEKASEEGRLPKLEGDPALLVEMICDQ